MKLKTAGLLIASSLLLGACSYLKPAATTTAPQTITPTPAVSVSPTSTNLKDLDTELNATIDDGGAADLKQLQKDAQGL
ncbi:MAG: hypothetical protein WAV56_03210 [Microgenomates group bacterium]